MTDDLSQKFAEWLETERAALGSAWITAEDVRANKIFEALSKRLFRPLVECAALLAEIQRLKRAVDSGEEPAFDGLTERMDTALANLLHEREKCDV